MAPQFPLHIGTPRHHGMQPSEATLNQMNFVYTSLPPIHIFSLIGESSIVLFPHQSGSLLFSTSSFTKISLVNFPVPKRIYVWKINRMPTAQATCRAVVSCKEIVSLYIPFIHYNAFHISTTKYYKCSDMCMSQEKETRSSLCNLLHNS
jgi:hypothetical protein